VFCFARKGHIVKALGGADSSVSGNYWYGIQSLKNWFLVSIPGDKASMSNALRALSELQRAGEVTGWDWDNDGGKGKLLSCNRCGTKKLDCGVEGLPKWHDARDRMRCPSGGKARNTRARNAKAWMHSDFSEFIIGRTKLMWEAWSRPNDTGSMDMVSDENNSHPLGTGGKPV
jgi:hypothetical protein